MKNKTIPIFFAVDDRYVPYLATALHSLMQNANKEYEYEVIIMYDELSAENQVRIRTMKQKRFSFRFIPMKERLEEICDQSNTLRCDYFTYTIYFRIFIPVMFPEYEKGIYMDCDVVVPGDISELYQVELGDNLLGACTDASIQSVLPITEYIDKAIGVEHGSYFNSGVLLLNMEKLRECALDKKFLSLLHTYHFDSIAPDQDYLNAMCYQKIVFLDKVWDAMPGSFEKELEHPKLIHYNLFAKPWCYDNVQYEDYFWHYAKETGYYDEILTHKLMYSKAQKESDEKSMNRILTRATEIVQDGVTFASAFNTGREERI